MAALSTEYMNLSLKNPLQVSACGLTGTLEGVQRCAEAGAGSIVLKSLFEEQITADTKDQSELAAQFVHPDAYTYMTQTGMLLEPEKYLRLIEEAKKKTGLPIIASLNCLGRDWWIDYAKQIEAAGADGLEINISLIPHEPSETSEEVEKKLARTVDTLYQKVKLPLAVKIGREYTTLPRITRKVMQSGAAGLVLFNRFYRPDIDIENLAFTGSNPYSSPAETSEVLRWVGLLSEEAGLDIAATTGIHHAEEVVKHLLAGAAVTQICSTLYLNKVSHIKTILKGLEDWMDRKGFPAVSDFRGKLAFKDNQPRHEYERQQYVKALVGYQ